MQEFKIGVDNNAKQSFFKNLHQVASPTIKLQPFDDEFNNYNQTHQMGTIAPTNNVANVVSTSIKLNALEYIESFLACINNEQKQATLIL